MNWFSKDFLRRSRFNNHFGLRNVLVNFGPYGRGAISAEIFELFTFGQDQKQPLPYGYRCLAPGTVKRSRFKLFETGFLHTIIIRKDDLLNNPFFFLFEIQPSINYERAKPVQELISKHRYIFPVLVDPNGAALDLFEVNGISPTFSSKREGKWLKKQSVQETEKR